jgi:hypothetical protein
MGGAHERCHGRPCVLDSMLSSRYARFSLDDNHLVLTSMRTDVVKSRIQMADKPPQGGIFYISRTFAAIAREEGL